MFCQEKDSKYKHTNTWQSLCSLWASKQSLASRAVQFCNLIWMMYNTDNRLLQVTGSFQGPKLNCKSCCHNSQEQFSSNLNLIFLLLLIFMLVLIVLTKAAVPSMHYGIRADILKKTIRKCLTLKIDFSANFDLTHDFFGRRLSQHPKNWKTQKWIYKYQFKGV